MTGAIHPIRWLHRGFIFLLFGAYVLASILPAPGLWMKSISWEFIPVIGNSLTTSLLMLAVLLFNAGLSVDQDHLIALKRRPMLSFAGILGKAALAIGWISILLLALWVGSTMTSKTLWISMLAGFAIVSIMPAATSSTAWAQQSNANLALSLGLLLLSTMLAPVTIPVMSWITSRLPLELSSNRAMESANLFDVGFLATWILIPIALGLLTQLFLKRQGTHKIRPWLRTINAVNLLLLNYMHGSSFLPQCLHPFQPVILGSILIGVLICCVSAFGVGSLVGRLSKAPEQERLALMFGTGMNNNGMALVLASHFLGEASWIGLTIALCTFGQHVVAGFTQNFYGCPNPLSPSEKNPSDSKTSKAPSSSDKVLTATNKRGMIPSESQSIRPRP